MELKVKEFELPKDGNFSEEEVKGLNAIVAHFNEQLKGFAAELKDPDEIMADVKSQFETLGLSAEKMKKLEEALEKQGTTLTQLKNGRKAADPNTVGAKIKAFIEDKNMIEDVKTGKRMGVDLTLKEVGPMMTTNSDVKPVVDLLSTEVDRTIHSAPTEPNAVYPRLLKGTANAKNITWINRVDGEGGSAWIEEGQLKPLKDWGYESESATAKKIAVSTKVSTEMLYDFAFMRSEIETLLRKDLMDKVNESVLTGTGVGAEILGVTTNAAGYTATELNGKVQMPNYGDAVRAAVLQMRLLNFTPDTLFINPTDKALIDLSKDTTGHYLTTEIRALMSGITIVETTNIEAGKFLLMDTAAWTVRVYEQLRLEYGWENDDFRKNMVTVIAEMRLFSYQNSIDKGAIVYDSFDTVMAAIKTA